MKFVVFGADEALGMVHGDRILDLATAASTDGGSENATTVFGSLLTLIEAGDRGLNLAAELMDKYAGSDRPGVNLDLQTTPLRAPFPGRRLAFAGNNFATHVANAFTNRGNPKNAEDIYAEGRKSKATGFWVISPPVGTGAEIPVPRAANGVDALFDYEGEVAVVLGRGGKRLRAQEWEPRIWGTVLMIDWSLRPPTGLAGARPFYGHKNFDASKSLGPWISVGEVDPMNCQVQTRVNGDVRQDFNTAEMTYSYAELLEQIAEDLTLLPGDILSGGTGPGTAMDATKADADGPGPLDLYLDPGDAVVLSSPELGALRGRVVAGD